MHTQLVFVLVTSPVISFNWRGARNGHVHLTSSCLRLHIIFRLLYQHKFFIFQCPATIHSLNEWTHQCNYHISTGSPSINTCIARGSVWNIGFLLKTWKNINKNIIFLRISVCHYKLNIRKMSTEYANGRVIIMYQYNVSNWCTFHHDLRQYKLTIVTTNVFSISRWLNMQYCPFPPE